MSASISVAATLARKRRRTVTVLWTERLVGNVAAAAIPPSAFICAALLGWLQDLPAWLHLLLLLGVLGTTVGLAWRGARRLLRPAASEIDRRLEVGAGDTHRALATLADQPAWPGDDAVWQAHRDRALARITTLHPGWPRLRRVEMAGLAIGTTALLVCLGVAATSGPARLWAAVTPRLPVAPPPDLQAWIMPPHGTGLAPIFLHAGEPGPFAVPLGSHLSVTVVGGRRVPTLQYGTRDQPFQRLDRTSFQAELTLNTSATLLISRAATIARWDFTVTADQSPTIRIAGLPGRRETVLVLPWSAADDYGLAGVAAELQLRDRPDIAPVHARLPLEGNPRHATGSDLPDLTAHPWAGLPVRLRYVATDGGGQRGASGLVVVTLPERAFANPIAGALIALRRRLVIDPAAPAGASTELDRLSGPAATQLTTGQWLNLRGIAALLGERPVALDEAEARLWQLALAIEDAGLNDARQHLADASRALDDALAAAADANRQLRIEALTRQLQQAMQHYLQALQLQAGQQQAGRSDPSQTERLQSGGRTVDAAQLQQMAQQLADAARAGRTEEAEARLRDLGALLNSLRPAARSAASAAPRDGALTRLFQDQGTLQSHADRRLSEDADPRASPGPERDPDEAAGQPDAGRQRKADAAGQGALRRRLGDLAQRLGATNGQVPDGLAKADAAMRDAAGALSRGDDAAARGAQQRALDGLRQGGDALAQQGPGQPGGTPGPGQDPLGRSDDAGGQNPDEADDVALPANADATSSRALRDELRRRAADRTRRQQELDYLDRLLKAD